MMSAETQLNSDASFTHLVPSDKLAAASKTATTDELNDVQQFLNKKLAEISKRLLVSHKTQQEILRCVENQATEKKLEAIQANQVQIKENQCKILNALKRIQDAMRRSIKILTSLASGRNAQCPKLVLIVLDKKKWYKAKVKVKVYFVCQHSLTQVEPPIVLKMTKNWVKRVAPYIKASIFVIQAAARVATGFNIPFLSEFGTIITEADSYVGAFLGKSTEALLDDVKARLDPTNGDEVVDATPRLQKLMGSSYRAISEIALQQENSEWETAVTPVEKDIETIWVKKEFEHLY